MATYLDILNSARAEYGATPLGATAVGENSGDALQGVQAAKKAIQHFIQDSFDIDATEKIEEVSTTVANGELTSPSDTWDSNVIKWIKYKKSGETSLLKMALISPEQAEDYKLKTFQSNDPQYWYVLGGKVYILPVPTQVYTLVVSYQQIVPYITASNITDTIVLPDSALLALQSGMYAYLRKADGDPEWQSYFKEFDSQKQKFFERNKHTYKRKGWNRFRMNYNYADRTL